MSIGRPLSNRYKAGDVVESKHYGKFLVVRVDSATRILCKSLTTGYEIFKQAAHLDSGSIKDPFYPSILGVGYFGDGKHTSKSNPKMYQAWRNMLARCYYPDYQKNNQSYAGCVVCDDWHNFQTFANWYVNNFIEGYQLDKDIAGNGSLYSPETCTFVTALENVEEAHCATVKIKSPSGEVIHIDNVSKFARENNLSQGHLSSVVSGKRNSHKGYTRA